LSIVHYSKKLENTTFRKNITPPSSGWKKYVQQKPASSIIFWDMMLCSLLSFKVSTDVSEEHIASIFRVEEICSAKTGKQYHLVGYDAV
jgi:hypothetical protein